MYGSSSPSPKSVSLTLRPTAKQKMYTAFILHSTVDKLQKRYQHKVFKLKPDINDLFQDKVERSITNVKCLFSNVPHTVIQQEAARRKPCCSALASFLDYHNLLLHLVRRGIQMMCNIPWCQIQNGL